MFDLDELIELYVSGNMHRDEFEQELAVFYEDKDDFDVTLRASDDEKATRAFDNGQFGVGA